MEFICEKSVLLDAVSTSSRAVSAKSTIQALEGILMCAKNNSVSLCGYDLKTAIKCCVEADVKEEGSVVISARVIGDIIRKLPDSSVYISCNDDNIITIKCDRAEFNIIGISSSDFPELPDVDKEASVKLPKNTLKNMISQTIFAVSCDESKPVHTGTKFEINNNEIKLISVDGFRLAIRTEVLECSCEKEYSFIVPGTALKEVERVLDDTEDYVTIFSDSKFILFDIGGVSVITRLLEGDFLNYKKAIPSDCSINYRASVSELVDCVERVSLIISEKMKNPLRCTFGDNSVKFTCITQIGKSYDECMVSGSGEPLEIGFNHRYVLDALRACPDDEVCIMLKNELSPCVIKPVGGDKFVYLILPVRLKV